MRVRDLALKLEDLPGVTLSRRIAKAIEDAIRDGRLKPGIGLPGSRALAEDLGVNRNTVIAALGMLESEGWLESEANRGTFVANRLPEGGTSLMSPGPAQKGIGFDLPSSLPPITAAIPGALNLSDGNADSRLAPTEEMGKAYQRALRRHGQDLLKHGEPHGNLLLRQAIAEWVSVRHGVAIEPDQVLITMGGRMSLSLISMALLRPGDTVAVEDPGNRTAWDTLRKSSQANLLPLPVDEHGLIPEALEEALKTSLIRMVYTTPRRQFPTGAVLSSARAQRLLELAAAHRVAIFEDDYDAEIQYEEQPVLPLFSKDPTGQVIFASSFSRIMAPGLRVGYLVLPPALVAPLARMRRDLEMQGDRVLEWSVADLLRDGEVARHLRRVRRIYESRRDCLVDLLKRYLGDTIEMHPPKGGLGIWIQVKPDMNVGAWVEECKRHGLVLHPPQNFYLKEPERCFRMGFSQADEVELEEAVKRLVLARTSMPTT